MSYLNLFVHALEARVRFVILISVSSLCNLFVNFCLFSLALFESDRKITVHVNCVRE